MGGRVPPYQVQGAADPDDPLAAGHFTSFQVRDGLVQGRDLHLLRLRDGSRRMYGGGPGKADVRALIRGRLYEAGEPARHCTLRVLVRPVAANAEPGNGAIFSPPFECPHLQHAGRLPPPQRVEIEIQPPREIDASALRLRSHVGLRAWPDVKHLATGPQLQARESAIEAGFDDAVLVSTDGDIAEGTFWNLGFWDGSVLTWPRAPALPGITAWRLDGALDGAGIPRCRMRMPLHALAGQRAAFALNSRGVREIASIDGHVFAGDRGFVERLRALLDGDAWEAF